MSNFVRTSGKPNFRGWNWGSEELLEEIDSFAKKSAELAITELFEDTDAAHVVLPVIAHSTYGGDPLDMRLRLDTSEDDGVEYAFNLRGLVREHANFDADDLWPDGPRDDADSLRKLSTALKSLAAEIDAAIE